MELQAIDLTTLQRKGISKEQLEEELKMLKEGFPFLKIYSAATIGKGIMALSDEDKAKYIKIWNEYQQKGGKVVKMVPASGAASRMFKDLFSFANGASQTPDNDFIKRFCDNIEKFAFFPILNKKCVALYGKSIDSLFAENRHRDVVATLILKEGLNYGQLPKALLEFHKSIGTSRAALEEHLAEGAQYAACADKSVNIHFTVSDDHLNLMAQRIEEAKAVFEHAYGVTYNVSMSVQKPSTDTVAANMDGSPYRENGELFFRPGGHGALIENLNDIDGDVIFIKNIDNVVPDSYRDVTIEYKQVIGGVLVEVKEKIDRYAEILRTSTPSDDQLCEMLSFLRTTLCVTGDNADNMRTQEKIDYLLMKFNRPIRVCGMVRNEGEPGGGPFLAYNNDGTISPQILESTQINPDDATAVEMLKMATHFNPVDLVCYTRDLDGNKFDLPKYVDKNTGFISIKSREGVEIKALELPGLWNGAMSDWNTIMVEVPAQTFNPVKTVNDLLRPAHQ